MSRRTVLDVAIKSGAVSTVTLPPTLKPIMAGLVPVCDTLKGATSVNSAYLVNGINHITLRLKWSDLEPTEGNFAFSSFLDPLLATAPAGTFFKFGIDTGQWAPGWLKAQTGNIDVVNSKDGVTANCPWWWTDTAHNAYAALMAALAARYDSDPRVKMVIATGSMQVYFEPWILGSDAPSGVRMYNAGCDQATQMASIERSLRETLAAWPTTRVEFATHLQWQLPKPTGILFQPWSFGRDWLNPISAEFGDKLLITDYGLGQSDTKPDTTGQTLATATAQYGWMFLRGALGLDQGPVAWQLTLAGYTGTFAQAMADAINNILSMGGVYCETANFGALTGAQRASFDASLKAIAA